MRAAEVTNQNFDDLVENCPVIWDKLSSTNWFEFAQRRVQ